MSEQKPEESVSVPPKDGMGPELKTQTPEEPDEKSEKSGLRRVPTPEEPAATELLNKLIPEANENLKMESEENVTTGSSLINILEGKKVDE